MSCRESALIRGKFCHMTVENMERWRSDRVTSPNFLLDAPEFDPHFGDQDEDCR